MPPFNESFDRASPSFAHPVSEALSRYFAMTAPTRPRGRTDPRGPQARDAAGPDDSAQIRAEELWDALGDFA